MSRFFSFAFLAIFCMSLVVPYNNTNSTGPLWMRYPVISPDGQTIVFTYKGDLYKVDSKGGNATILTLGDSYDYMPVFSPDGKSVVFSSDRYGQFDLFLISINGGTAKRLTHHSSPDYPYSFSKDGKRIYYGSSRLDHVNMSQFPNAGLGEVYSVSVDGGREKQEMSIAAEGLVWSADESAMLFFDKKGYEDPMRKHHQSSVARDLWLYQKKTNQFTKLTDFEGEDRSPVWSSNPSEVYYLSEKGGSFNVWKMNLNDPDKSIQVSDFDKNPVRFLSIAYDNTLCYGYDGQIYTQKEGESAQLVSIQINTDERYAEITRSIETSGATEMSVSPNGKEVAFIVKGEVFVVSMEGGVTRRITETPATERSLSFSPDGKALLYASERNNIWGIYQTKLQRAEEKYFYSATLLKEEALIENQNESFQPLYSPDGKEIAYLENRTAINVYNILTKKIRTVLPADKNYSYSDGDQGFDWSPDSKYLLVSHLQENNWHTQMALLDVSGRQAMIPITQNGFSNYGGKFQMEGKSLLWFSNKNGMKNVASHGSQDDVYAMFLNQKSWDLYRMNKTDYEASLEVEKDKKPETGEKKTTETQKNAVAEKVKDIQIDLDGLMDRKVRLTDRSAFYGDALLSPNGESFYYFASFDEGVNLYVKKLKDDETKVLTRLKATNVGPAQMDKEGKFLYVLVDGSITKITLSGGEQSKISFKAEMTRNEYAERAYLFEHIWRQVTQKFYKKDLHQVDWAAYKATYAKFLPHINNNRDFAEMASELLGELNASHTGCFYTNRSSMADQTASLGAFFDENYSGKGLKIAEILSKGPLQKSNSKIKVGDVIEKIDGQEIKPESNYFEWLNRKAGKYTLLSVRDGKTGALYEETVKPITQGEMNELLYERWIKRMQTLTEKYSNGKIGYMHVKGMDDNSFREFYDQVMGKYVNKDALVVDTRFNGGGWLHDDLVTFLSGKTYIQFIPRGQKIGVEPGNKWVKPSTVLVCEGNYSDAHMFPVVYQTLGVGKVVGMPVPGTGTAVWWENLGHHNLVFGIPEVGVVSMDGQYYENNPCIPDIIIENDYNTMLSGEDAQLKKAIEALMQK